MLEAATRAMAGMRRRGHALRPTFLVSRVQLGTEVLGLQVHDEALDDFLAEVLPVGRRHGIPDLRTRPRRDHVELWSPDGELRLLGVTRERWRRASADLAASPAPPPTPPPPLPTALMSGVLRRLPLWRGAAWLDGVVVGEALELYWRGGPPSEAVAAILTASTCGIPATTAAPYNFRNTVRGVALSAVGPAPTPVPEEPEWAWTEWLATAAPGPAEDERAVRPVQVRADLPEVWEQHEMRTALALRDITTVYRLLTSHGVPRERIATLTGQQDQDVDRVLSGAKVESYTMLADIATGLGVPLGYMGLAYDEHPGTTDPCHCTTLDERTKRDKFLAHAALVTVGSTTSRWGCTAKTCRSAHPA